MIHIKILVETPNPDSADLQSVLNHAPIATEQILGFFNAEFR